MATAWSVVKALLNKFSDTQTALRLNGKPYAQSNPQLGDAIEAQITATAGSAPYTPADTTKWTGADPTTVQQALDRIAAALGPIA